MKTFISAKIHRIVVTEAELDYIGSATIDTELLDACGIEPYEKIEIANVDNGQRWATYALPGTKGTFALNGAAARMGCVGDTCIVMAYKQEEHFSGATALICNPDNSIKEILRYPITEPRPVDGPSVKVD